MPEGAAAKRLSDAANPSAANPAAPGAPRLEPVAVQFGPLRFDCSQVAGAQPFALVLLADDYRELARCDAIAAWPWHPPPEVLGALSPGATAHCFALARTAAGIVKSPLTTFAVP